MFFGDVVAGKPAPSLWTLSALLGTGGRGSLHGLWMSGEDRFATGVVTIFL